MSLTVLAAASGAGAATRLAAQASTPVYAQVSMDVTGLPPVVNADSIWRALEAGTGRSGDLSRIRWHVFTRDDVHLDGKQVTAVWFPPHDVYLLPQNLDGRFSLWYAQRNIAHEMLHDLARSTDHGPVFDSCDVE